MRSVVDQPIGHAVYTAREIRHFVRLAGWQASGKVARRDGFGGGHRLPERSEDDPVHLPGDVRDQDEDIGRDQEADVQRPMTRVEHAVQQAHASHGENDRRGGNERDVEQQLGAEGQDAMHGGMGMAAVPV